MHRGGLRFDDNSLASALVLREASGYGFLIRTLRLSRIATDLKMRSDSRMVRRELLPSVGRMYSKDTCLKKTMIRAGFSLDGDDWYNTGDMGRMDGQGFLFLTGRKKDLIIRGGHNIDPAMIENAIEKHPGVDLVAALGSPDARVGEVPIAFVTLREGTGVAEEELLNFARTEIPERAAIPKRIFVLESMPLTAVGKIFKPELRRMEVGRVMAELLSSMPEGEGLHAEVVRTEQKGLVVRIHSNGEDVAAQVRKVVERRVGEFALNVEFHR